MAATKKTMENKVMRVYVTEKVKDIEAFVNAKHIQQEDILGVEQQNDGNFMLIYFEIE